MFDPCHRVSLPVVAVVAMATSSTALLRGNELVLGSQCLGVFTLSDARSFSELASKNYFFVHHSVQC